MRRHWSAILALVVAGLAPAGCQHAAQSRATTPPETSPTIRWTSLLCTPAVSGVAISTQNVPMGTRVLFAAHGPAADIVRDSVFKHAKPSMRGVAPGPVIATNALPPDTRVAIENVPGGTAVTYTGHTPDEERVIRMVVIPAARGLSSGKCTMLEAVMVPAGSSTVYEAEAPAG